MNCKNWSAKKSAATNALAGSNSCPKFRRPPRENSSASNSGSCKIVEPTMLSNNSRSFLRVEEVRIGRQSGQISCTSRWALNNKTPMVEQQSAQPGKFFTAAGSSRTAVKATRHNVSVPSELCADAGINNHDAAMQIVNAEHDPLEKGRIVRKNRSNKLPKTATRNSDEIFPSVV